MAVDDGYVVSFGELAQFHLNFESQSVTVFCAEKDISQTTLSHLLCDHIAPRILAHQGEFVLHGSAVKIGGTVALFLGDTGTGKSTLAASLHKAGHRLLGDDAAMITQGERGFLAAAVYPSLRLFRDSVSAIVGNAANTSPMAQYSDKRRVALFDEQDVQPAHHPIGAVFFLSGDADAREVSVRQPSPAKACIATLEQSFSLDPHDGARAADRLAIASQLIEKVNTFDLEYPNGFDRLENVHAVIEACMRGGGSTGTGLN